MGFFETSGCAEEECTRRGALAGSGHTTEGTADSGPHTPDNYVGALKSPVVENGSWEIPSSYVQWSRFQF